MSYYKIGEWYEEKKREKIKVDKKKFRIVFFKNLKKIGFRYFNVYKKTVREKKIIKSFQQHYLPQNVTGKIDQKTLKISHLLSK